MSRTYGSGGVIGTRGRIVKIPAHRIPYVGIAFDRELGGIVGTAACPGKLWRMIEKTLNETRQAEPAFLPVQVNSAVYIIAAHSLHIGIIDGREVLVIAGTETVPAGYIDYIIRPKLKRLHIFKRIIADEHHGSGNILCAEVKLIHAPVGGGDLLRSKVKLGIIRGKLDTVAVHREVNGVGKNSSAGIEIQQAGLDLEGVS